MIRHLKFFVLLCFGIAAFSNAAVLDDLEHGTSKNLFGGPWLAYADRDDDGNSTIVNGELVPGTINYYSVMPTQGQGNPAGTFGSGMVMEFEFGDREPGRGGISWGQTVGIRTDLSYIENGARDISGATHVTFYAKASKRMSVRFMVPITTVEDFAYHQTTVTIDTVWTQEVIQLNGLDQPGWGVSRSFDPALVQSFQWEITVDNNASLEEGKLWLDDIEIVPFNAQAPIIVTRNETTIDTRPTFKWHTLQGASSYNIQIDSDPTFSSDDLISMDVVDTAFTPLVDLTLGPKYWKVKADNSGYSATGLVTIVDSRIPELIPVESPTMDTLPVLKWHPSPGGVSSYHIQLATDTEFSYSSRLDSATVTDTAYQPSVVLPFGTVYWRVRGGEAEYSPVSSFEVIDGRIPVLIPIESPTRNRRPTFRWHPPEIPVSICTLWVNPDGLSSPPVTYAVTDTFFTYPVNLPLSTTVWKIKGGDSEWSHTDTFEIFTAEDLELIPIQSPVSNEHPITFRWRSLPYPIDEFSVQIAETRYFSSSYLYFYERFIVSDTFLVCDVELPVDTPLYWRIYAEGHGPSEVQSFRVRDYRIPQPIPFSPDITTENRPTFRWHSVTGASTYTVQIDDNIQFSSPQSVPTGDTTFQVVVPLEPGPVYWRVRSDLVSVYSDRDHFTIQADTVPSLVRYDGATTSDPRPVFEWSSVEGATSYKLMLADNGSFSDAFTFLLTETVYSPQTDLDYGTWYWKVSSSRDDALYSIADSLVISPSVSALGPDADRAVRIRQTRAGVSVVASRSLLPGAVKIYDLSGRLVSEPKLSGDSRSVVWNFSDRGGAAVSPGVYFMHICSGNRRTVHRVTKQ
ncbi:MAG: T9SS type A sorting domain-containing protein [Fibrobacterota bacterium]